MAFLHEFLVFQITHTHKAEFFFTIAKLHISHSEVLLEELV